MALLAKTKRNLSFKFEREADPVRNANPHSPSTQVVFVMKS
jgi:hypothetical protein